MNDLIGLLIVLCIAVSCSNKTIDSKRVKQWFDKEMKSK